MTLPTTNDPFVDLFVSAQWGAVVLGIVGGLAANLSSYRNPGIPVVDRLWKVFVDIFVSGFAAMMIYNLAIGSAAWFNVQIPSGLIIFLVGIYGHLGTRGLILLSKWAEDKVSVMMKK